MVRVFLSFAVEDFVLPRSDDIVLALAQSLERLGVRGNFHITGDKVRTLVARGREDVIEALGRHVVGYHTNSHGIRPFLGWLLDMDDWDASLREVLFTEAPGIRDLTTAFGRLPAYAVSEFFKGPQLISAYQLLGIRSGVLISSLASLPGPAVWLCNLLLLNTDVLISLEDPPTLPDRLNALKAHIDQRLQRAREGDGVAVAFVHPYKYACESSKSWGAWNALYRGGAAPGGPVNLPPTYDESITAWLLEQFEQLVAYIISHEDVQIVDRAMAPEVFHDAAGTWVDRDQIARLAREVLTRLDYCVLDRASYTPAEVFGLLVRALASYGRTGSLPERVMVRPLLGPVAEPVQRSGVVTEARALVNACMKLDWELDESGRLPAATPVLYVSLGPGTMLRALARTYLELVAGREPPVHLDGVDGPELPVVAGHEYFQEQTFTHGELYPDGFTGEQVCRYCRWQSWSFKPAVEG